MNDSIQSYALMQHSQLWEMIEKIFPRDYQKSSQIIIDGSLEKLSYRLTQKNQVIEKLMKIVC